jgi:hypothetical protein
MKHLTSENLPMYLMRDKTLTEKEFEYVEDIELIKGKSIIINRAGLLWLYMADDHRKEEPSQIIVKRLGHYEMGFLPIESKKAIRLTKYKYA